MLPISTFRAWFLGITSCVAIPFIQSVFFLRQNPFFIPSNIAVLLAFPAGKLMARTLPVETMIKVPGTKWRFSLNPGSFNMRGHVLISLLASAGGNHPFAMVIVTEMKVLFHRYFHPLLDLLIIQTTQLLGYGFAGICMKLLVDFPYMWWSSALVNVSFYRAFHSKEIRKKGQLTGLQFFIVSNTLANPLSSSMNQLVGFILIMYVIIPITYWTNSYNAKRFPLFSSNLFDASGNIYNVSRVLDEKNFKFDEQGFIAYSKVHISIVYFLNVGFSLAVVMASLAHFVIFDGAR